MDIKGIILDIDGVIVGEKIGFNSPWPHPDVTKALKKIRAQNIPICLITAKPHFAIKKIIADAKLNNPHVTDGGSVIIDPIDKILVKKHIIESTLTLEILNLFLSNNVYVEIYTVDDYYIQADQKSDITQKHTHILQREPIVVSSLIDQTRLSEITKIMPVALNTDDIKRVEKIFEQLKNKLTLYWAVHPIALPLQFGIIVPKGISKTEGIREMVSSLNLSFDNLLGIGDSTSDWQFMQYCKYVVAMGNASEELKELVRSKKEDSFICPTVDENGIIKAFEHFNLV